MKNNVLLGITLALAMGAAVPAVMSAVAAPAAPAAPAPKPDNLEKVMGRMGKTLKALKTQAIDPAQQASALALISQLQKDIVAAKEMTPPALPKDADAHAKAIASYRALLVNLLRQTLDLEEAVQDKKADEATKVIASIIEIEKQGHMEFRPKEN